MKKLYFLVLFILSWVSMLPAQNCFIDTANHAFFSPPLNTLPCVTTGLYFSQIIQIYVPDTLNYGVSLTLDSIAVDSVTGTPTGIIYVLNPSFGTVLYGGDHACGAVNGTTTDTPGTYTLTIHGWVHLHGQVFPGYNIDTLVPIQTLEDIPGNPFKAQTIVIAPGDSCPNQPGLSPCTIDTTFTRAFFSPALDSLECIVQNSTYGQVVQLFIPDSVALNQLGSNSTTEYQVLSLQFDSIGGMPEGIIAGINPPNGQLSAGGHSCIFLGGTTNVATAVYPLRLYGTILLKGPDGDTTLNLRNLQMFPGSPFAAAVSVISQAANCVLGLTSIRKFDEQLNASIAVFPNPNNGVFQLQLSSTEKLSGEINVFDVTGNKLWTQPFETVGEYQATIDISRFSRGLYIVRVRTNNGGTASRKISFN